MLRALKKQYGFSLIEIMIVMAIMGGLAVVASRSIKNATDNKKKITARLKVESVVYDALRLMATDVEKSFHHQPVIYEMERQALAQQQRKAQQQQGQQGANPQQFQQLQPPLLLTQFIGKETSMHFTTLNHQRTTANARESNQVEVGYFLRSCRPPGSKQESQCLWRRSSSVIDNDVTRDGGATPLVENVTDFKLSYWSEDPNAKDWRTTWLTDANGDQITQNMFPNMVKITLEVHDPDNKVVSKFRQTVVAVVRFTNNMDPAKRFAAPMGAAPGGNPNANANPNANPGGRFQNPNGGGLTPPMGGMPQ